MVAALRLFFGDTETHAPLETLAKVFREQVRPQLEKGRRAVSTCDEYERSIRLWEKLAMDPAIEEITEASLDHFQDALVAQGLSARTVNKHCSYLQTVLNHCGTARRTRHRKSCLGRPLGLVEQIPEFQLLEEDEPESRAVPSHEEVARMLASTSVAQVPLCQADLKWEALLRLLMWCGPRRSDSFAELTVENWIREERCPIRSIDLRWPYGWLSWVVGKTKRTQKRPLVVPLPPRLSSCLARIIRPERPAASLLGFAQKGNVQWYRELYRIQAAAGLDQRYAFHALRKRCNIDWDLACGLRTGELFLGHAAQGVNRRSYSESSALMVRAAEKRLSQCSDL